MALVDGVPFLRLLLERIYAQGIREVILGTGYLAEQIEDYFGNGENVGLRIEYSRELAPLGTGGAVKLAESQLSDHILILNGDSYVEWNLDPMLQLAQTHDADLVLALQSVPDATRYGAVLLAGDGRVNGFVEKGSHGSGLINAGVYLLRKTIVTELPDDQPISLEKEVFPRLLTRRVYGLVIEGAFIDIGVPAELERAQTLLARRNRS